MKRFASVRFDRVLELDEREVTARTLRSAGATLTSWSAAAGATYARLRLAPHAEAACVAKVAGARVDEPALTVLRIVPNDARRVPALAAALGGAARPAGVREVRREADTLVVEFSAGATPLSLLVDVVDVELARSPGRRIEPLLPLDDEALSAFARDVLRDPDLSPGRIVETHLEPLLRGAEERP